MGLSEEQKRNDASGRHAGGRKSKYQPWCVNGEAVSEASWSMERY